MKIETTKFQEELRNILNSLDTFTEIEIDGKEYDIFVEDAIRKDNDLIVMLTDGSAFKITVERLE